MTERDDWKENTPNDEIVMRFDGKAEDYLFPVSFHVYALDKKRRNIQTSRAFSLVNPLEKPARL